jgi:sugar O-acyltransferase (sialic acid O-acetyltransferase NeuD family)
MIRRLAIYGAGGFGREVAAIARYAIADEQSAILTSDTDDKITFVTDIVEQQGKVINGVPIISFEDLCSSIHRDREVVIALADSGTRRQIASRCEDAGFSIGKVRAKSHLAYDDVRIGDGAILCDNTIITSNVRIGRHFHCNIYSYVAHDCVIGDFVTFAPRVNCNGNVLIEDDVYVGTGAFLKQGSQGEPLRIGRGAIIGMGAVVTKDVPAYTTVVGNPARPLGNS